MKKFSLALILICSLTAISFYITGISTPRLYRHSDNKTTLAHSFSSRCKQANWAGIEDLNLAGSGYLNATHLKKIARKNEDVIIFNVTYDEEDFQFINGKNLKWYYGLVQQKDHVIHIIRGFIRNTRYKIRQTIDGVSTHTPIDSISEQELVAQQKNVRYIQITPPTWLSDFSYIDQTIEAFESIPAGTEVYFHCNHGKGRTTTFMALYDIFRNHNIISKEDSMDRQFCLGGEDIANIVTLREGKWKPESLIARKNLVTYFHQYMNDPKGYGYQLWSTWLKENNIYPNPELEHYKR